MNTIFDKKTNDELIKRIHSLNENSKAQWGKMTGHNAPTVPGFSITGHGDVISEKNK